MPRNGLPSSPSVATPNRSSAATPSGISPSPHALSTGAPSRRSTTVTASPARRARIPVASPAGPPPTISRSITPSPSHSSSPRRRTHPRNRRRIPPHPQPAARRGTVGEAGVEGGRTGGPGSAQRQPATAAPSGGVRSLNSGALPLKVHRKRSVPRPAPLHPRRPSPPPPQPRRAPQAAAVSPPHPEPAARRGTAGEAGVEGGRTGGPGSAQRQPATAAPSGGVRSLNSGALPLKVHRKRSVPRPAPLHPRRPSPPPPQPRRTPPTGRRIPPHPEPAARRGTDGEAGVEGGRTGGPGSAQRQPATAAPSGGVRSLNSGALPLKVHWKRSVPRPAPLHPRRPSPPRPSPARHPLPTAVPPHPGPTAKRGTDGEAGVEGGRTGVRGVHSANTATAAPSGGVRSLNSGALPLKVHSKRAAPGRPPLHPRRPSP